MSPFDTVIQLIDTANQADPNQETFEGKTYPKEYLYSLHMTDWLKRFAPDAGDHLKIAARGQHIERWKSKRSDYPEGRTGYRKWRAELGLFHAQRVGELMTQAGYDEQDVFRTQYLVQKRSLKRDPETQCLEDVICLVFLQYYLEDFAKKHDEDKLIDIIKKTWVKMSPAGQDTALTISLPSHLQTLVGKALAP